MIAAAETTGAGVMIEVVGMTAADVTIAVGVETTEAVGDAGASISARRSTRSRLRTSQSITSARKFSVVL
jgi:hypothetical protein